MNATSRTRSSVRPKTPKEILHRLKGRQLPNMCNNFHCNRQKKGFTQAVFHVSTDVESIHRVRGDILWAQ